MQIYSSIIPRKLYSTSDGYVFESYYSFLLKPDTLADLFDSSTRELVKNKFRVDEIVFDYQIDPSLIKLTVCMNGAKYGIFSYRGGEYIYVPDPTEATMISQTYKVDYFDYDSVQELPISSTQIINGYERLLDKLNKYSDKLSTELLFNTNTKYSLDELGDMINRAHGRQFIL